MAEKRKFEVIEDFKDLQDKDKIYRKGDSYPYPANKKVDDERLEELSSKRNKQGRPVIKEKEQA
ncbi:hypothetical protein CCZ20_24390 [Priestia aryabhattai]|uniref:hypothetical protein n=1 Tax=Priestia aryabhattai TaxID=412384 RepID=UPI000B50364B|nr:hypothetical protein [Priestia aryabhattai]OVE34793.1 hypothetical protein CCZ20_24390 [Priestia aryabhattai]